MTSPSHPFTAARAAEVAAAAAAAAGLPCDRAELIRLGSNAIVRLPGGIVARVARDVSWAQIARREVRVARAFLDAGVPSARPWPVSQPVVAEGHPVTFWAEVPGPLGEATVADLGAVLRVLHAADVQTELPPLDPWGHTPDQIEQAPVSDAERGVMRGVLAEVEDRWAGTEFSGAAGPVHGDAYVGNLVRDVSGAPVLLDFDSASTGPREWDLAPTGLYAAALGWISRDEYGTFMAAYGGFDVTESPAFGLLSRMRLLRMTAWSAMHAGESDRMAAEVSHRVACLADPDLPLHWSPR